jgi:DNA-binding transcriptional regulator YiaG
VHMAVLHSHRHTGAVLLAEARRLAPGGGRLIREAADLSLADVGKAIGKAPSTVMRWERGERRPTGEAAIRYVELLKALSKPGDQRPTARRRGRKPTSRAAG